MSPKRLTIAKLRESNKNVRFDDVVALLKRLGFTFRQRGSHAVFTYPGLQENLTIPHPHKTPFILPVYVRRILAILEDAGLDDDNGQVENETD